jgi:N-acyl-D-aspartate/D-glutamate deacylase
MAHDLVIRGGTVVDGRGGEPHTADVAIDGERIVYVGPNARPGLEEIDAHGLIVTPGFIDLHTHYDAQLTWDPILAPSSWHGVTTVVIGNCGVGFAPVRPEARSWMIEIMENVEEIPRKVLEAGMPWNWESFPDYLDALEARPHTVDIGAQVPHIALRGYVMGERAKGDEPATAEDLAAMAGLVEEALRAGALGFACSRTDSHRLQDGSLVPGSMADREELLALADGIRRAGRGAVQYLGNPLSHWEEDLDFMSEMARRSASTVHFLMVDKDWRDRAAGIAAANNAGVSLLGHIPPRAVGGLQYWRSGRHPFMDRPSIRATAALPWPERLARLRDPAFRAQVLSEPNEGEERLPEFARVVYRGFERMFEIDDYPNYEPDPKTDSIAARAAAAGQDPAAYAYDVMMRNDGEGMIYLAAANYLTGNFDELDQMIRDPGTIVSLSDGGAHCTRVIDASAPTFMLTHWARDRSRGETLPLELVVKTCTRDPALAYGLEDRGVIAPGYLADLNVIDFDRLRLPAPYVTFDLPAGGQRLLQKAEGYVATIKRGAVTFRDGEHAGVFPGKLIRGPQMSPAA